MESEEIASRFALKPCRLYNRASRTSVRHLESLSIHTYLTHGFFLQLHKRTWSEMNLLAAKLSLRKLILV